MTPRIHLSWGRFDLAKWQENRTLICKAHMGFTVHRQLQARRTVLLKPVIVPQSGPVALPPFSLAL